MVGNLVGELLDTREIGDVAEGIQAVLSIDEALLGGLIEAFKSGEDGFEGGERFAGGVDGKSGGLVDVTELADFGFGIFQFGDKGVGSIGAFFDEADGFGGTGSLINKGVDESLVDAVLDGAGGFANDDGGDGVFLVVDIEVKSGFFGAGAAEDGGEILAEILGDDDGAVKITSFDAAHGGGFVGESPFHGVVFFERFSEAIADVEIFAG